MPTAQNLNLRAAGRINKIVKMDKTTSISLKACHLNFLISILAFVKSVKNFVYILKNKIILIIRYIWFKKNKMNREPNRMTVKTGLEKLKERSDLKDYRLGLLCNQASVDNRYRHASYLIDQWFPGRLKALYSPQHGYFGEKQDNMIESEHQTEPYLGIPVFSLYGETRFPSQKMFDLIDLLIVDLQDVGTRVYTFATSVSYCMERARKFNKKVLILDRPNPLGGQVVEGNILCRDCTSFVGPYPIPMRHGLTMGELAKFYNRFFGIGCDLDVVPLSGWRRNMFFRDTGLPWVAPSPNLPTIESAMLYPGQVIWEGTNISEGRGTTQPFEIFGAPFINTRKILLYLGETKEDGAILRETIFEPTFNKWRGCLCKGFQIHIIDSEKFQPYLMSLKLLQAVVLNHGKNFEWKDPPYEYEYDRLPIDLILGDKNLKKQIEDGENISKLSSAWRDELKIYEKKRGEILLYV